MGVGTVCGRNECYQFGAPSVQWETTVHEFEAEAEGNPGAVQIANFVEDRYG